MYNNIYPFIHTNRINIVIKMYNEYLLLNV